MQKPITKRQKELLMIIYQYLANTGFPPSYEEMRERLGVSSNQSIIDLLGKLLNAGYIKKNEAVARGIVIMPLGYQELDQPMLAPVLGAAAAGSPIEAIELAGEWKPLSKEVAQYGANVSLIRVMGDSMINAGIQDGDLVLVKEEKEFLSGDIVLAKVDENVTIKRFMSTDTPPFIYLKPENPKYPNIPFTHEMRLIGKIVSLLRNSAWQIIT